MNIDQNNKQQDVKDERHIQKTTGNLYCTKYRKQTMQTLNCCTRESPPP